MSQGFENILCYQHFLAHIAVLAFGLTCSSTRRCYSSVNHFCVPLSCNILLCNENFVTYGAVLAFGLTCSSTRRCYSSVNHFGVALSCHYFLRNKHFVTYGAVLAFGQTGSSTGGSYSCVYHFGVTECVNSLCINFATHTDATFFACVRTSRCIFDYPITK